MRPLQRRHGVGGARDRNRRHVPARQHLFEDVPVGRVVVDDEHAQPFERLGFRRNRDELRTRRLVERHGEMERAAASDFAFDPQPAAHQLDQPQRNRQPEARAAEAARRRAVGLGEGLEDVLLLVGGNADAGIADAEVQERTAGVVGIRRGVDAQHDFALVRELDGVAEDVQEHLAQSAGVADEVGRHVGRDVVGELEPFLRGAERQQLGGVADGLAEIERGVVELEPLRFDLREVEDVVDDPEQRLGRRLHRVEVLVLFGRELGAERQRRHAEDRVERRPDLVAHVGQEHALRRGRVFGPPFGGFELLDELGEPRGLVFELGVRHAEVARVARKRLFRFLALGDVAGGGVDDLLLGKRRRRPEQPADRPVLVQVAVLEVDDLEPLGGLLRFLDARDAVVGVDQLDLRLRQQLRFVVAEDPLPGRVDALEVAVEAADAQHVERQREEIDRALPARAGDR